MDYIIGANTLIAEFMGRKFTPYKDNHSIDRQFDTYKECADWIAKNRCDGYIPELGWEKKSGEYDHNWTWLMPVVEKIIGIKFDDGDNAHLRTFGMINQENGNVMVRFNRYSLFESNTLIGATYLAVVDFIKWHSAEVSFEL